ncbi:MAG TPA: HTTM domain-containing protein [Ktedonobacteraceae bacterium]|jgi:hypothetical protein|nr:HTTM domain-containing protein [Ktedonobacteraceae bacterium]
MTLRQLMSAWIKFWFGLTSPVPVALFRIAIGLVILQAELLLVGKDVLLWYGPKGMLPPQVMKDFFWLGAPYFDVFRYMPQTDFAVLVFWNIMIAAAVCLIIGLYSRIAAIVVAICIVTLHNRMPFVINGGDNMLRILSIYLCFTRCDVALSCDSLIKRWRYPTLNAGEPKISILPQRVIQLQLSLAYLTTALLKMAGSDWLDGTAVYYALRVEEVYHYSIPWLTDNLLLCKFYDYATLFAEAGMGTLVWIREFRYPVLLSVLLMHLSIDTLMNFPVFEWIFCSALIFFVYPEDLKALADRIKFKVATKYGGAIQIVYNPSMSLQMSEASVLQGLDLLDRLEFVPDPETKRLFIARSSQPLARNDSFYELSTRLPILWIVGIVLASARLLSRQKTVDTSDLATNGAEKRLIDTEN